MRARVIGSYRRCDGTRYSKSVKKREESRVQKRKGKEESVPWKFPRVLTKRRLVYVRRRSIKFRRVARRGFLNIIIESIEIERSNISNSKRIAY